VVYDPAEIAKGLLERNFLPPDAFGSDNSSYDPEVREKLFEKLGLEDVGTCPAASEDYREQLAEIAGVELGEENTVDDSRVAEYTDEYSRAELMSAASTLEKDGANVGKTELAEWLAEQDARAVQYAFNDEDEEARRVAGIGTDENEEDNDGSEE